MGGHDLLAGVAAIVLVGAGAIALASAWLRRGRVARCQMVPTPGALDPATPVRSMWALAVVASAGAGVIHLALTPTHFNESGLLGLGFLVAASFQFGWIATAVMKPERVSAIAGIAGNGALMLAWAASRTIGLPFGQEPWAPEAIGRADLVAISLEAIVIVALLIVSSRWVRILESRFVISAASIGIVPVVGLMAVATILALSGSHDYASHKADATKALAIAQHFDLAARGTDRGRLSWLSEIGNGQIGSTSWGPRRHRIIAARTIAR